MQQSTALIVPERRHYLVPANINRLLKVIDAMTNAGEIRNVLVKGPQGSGKSDLVTQFAATRKRPLATLEVGRLSESTQIFGQMQLRDGKTVYESGLFTEALQTPHAVIHLQEINRPETDKALNAIFSVLDPTFRNIYMDEMHATIKVAEGVTFFATMNEGFEFIGTMPLDAALENRFAIKLNLSYLPPEQERGLIAIRTGLNPGLTVSLISMITRIRNNPQAPITVSIRDSLAMAELMAYGLSVADAIRTVIGSDKDKLESLLATEHMAGHDVSFASDEAYELMSPPDARPVQITTEGFGITSPANTYEGYKGPVVTSADIPRDQMRLS